MTLFQLLAVLFGLWMVYELYIHAKKKLLSGIELGFWLSLWLIFIIIAIEPDLLLGIAHQLHFTRVFDLLTVGALMILSVTIFLGYFAQKATQGQIQKLVRDQAINNVKPTVKKDEHAK